MKKIQRQDYLIYATDGQMEPSREKEVCWFRINFIGQNMFEYLDNLEKNGEVKWAKN